MCVWDYLRGFFYIFFMSIFLKQKLTCSSRTSVVSLEHRWNNCWLVSLKFDWILHPGLEKNWCSRVLTNKYKTCLSLFVCKLHRLKLDTVIFYGKWTSLQPFQNCNAIRDIAWRKIPSAHDAIMWDGSIYFRVVLLLLIKRIRELQKKIKIGFPCLTSKLWSAQKGSAEDK